MTDERKPPHLALVGEFKGHHPMPKVDELIDALNSHVARVGLWRADPIIEVVIDALIEIRNQLQWRK